MNVLGIDGMYKDNAERTLNYTTKIPENFEDFYQNSLASGKGFNPMDALEKQFTAQGLDKTNPTLYSKIIKYRDILQDSTQPKPYLKYCGIALGVGILLYSAFKLFHIFGQKDKNNGKAV